MSFYNYKVAKFIQLNNGLLVQTIVQLQQYFAFSVNSAQRVLLGPVNILIGPNNTSCEYWQNIYSYTTYMCIKEKGEK